MQHWPHERKRNIRQPIKKNTKLSSEVLDDASQDRVLQMLRDDNYWHERIKRVLAAAVVFLIGEFLL